MPVSEEPTLLIVEDDTAALRQMRWTFDGYAISTASDREAALEELKKTHFPVVLLDLGLPPDADGSSEGLAALQEILALDARLHACLIGDALEAGVAAEQTGGRRSFRCASQRDERG